MKRHLLILAAMLSLALQASAQSYKLYGIGFYNIENLFDTCHNEGKNDFDFLPNGTYKWNKVKYTHKLHNMAYALADMGTDKLPIGCAIIGLAEVESELALQDLVAQPELAARGYTFAHIEGEDRRGVDCALLYNPALFTLRDVVLHPYVAELEKDGDFRTRGFLEVSGVLDSEPLTVIVCHWPSRFSGSFYRESAGRQVRAIKDSIMDAKPDMKVIVMGDLNDDPQNLSVSKELRGKAKIEDVKKGDMYNPWWKILDSGRGTLSYNGSWNLFDQILLSHNLVDTKAKRDYSKLTYYSCQIQRRDYLLQTEGQYKGSPKRTTAGGVWLDGYSDHLPTVVYLIKEKK